MSSSDEFRKELHVFIVNWIRHYLDPGDIFTKKALDDWAKRNGYTKNDSTQK